MEKFKKSTTQLQHSLKFTTPIDAEEMKHEFETLVKNICIPTKTKNERRKGWERYVVYRHPEYLRPDDDITFDFSQLTYLNSIIAKEMMGSILISAMYAIIPPKGFIGMHRDGLGSKSVVLQRHIEDSIRLHIPIYTNKEVLLYIGDQFQSMNEGEMWMLNNYSYHGVVNQHESLSRNHLIFDVIPSPDFLALLKSMPGVKGFEAAKMLKYLLGNSNGDKVKEFTRQLPLIERVKLKLA